jgi:hypothetical protein
VSWLCDSRPRTRRRPRPREKRVLDWGVRETTELIPSRQPKRRSRPSVQRTIEDEDDDEYEDDLRPATCDLRTVNGER